MPFMYEDMLQPANAVFLIASTIAIIGFLAMLRGLFVNHLSFTNEERRGIWLISFVMYLLVSALIVEGALNWWTQQNWNYRSALWTTDYHNHVVKKARVDIRELKELLRRIDERMSIEESVSVTQIMNDRSLSQIAESLSETDLGTYETLCDSSFLLIASKSVSHISNDDTKEINLQELLSNLYRGRDTWKALEQLKQFLVGIDSSISKQDASYLENTYSIRSMSDFSRRIGPGLADMFSILQNETIGRMIHKYAVFLLPSADAARIQYEARSILSYSEALLIGSSSLFIPLLVLLWNTRRTSLVDVLQKLADWRMMMTGSRGRRTESLENAINQISHALEDIERLGQVVNPYFKASLSVGAVVVLLLGFINFTNLSPEVLYLVVVLVKVIPFLAILWYLLLLWIFLTMVQPIVSEDGILRRFLKEVD